MTAPTPPAARDAGVGELDAGGGAAFVEAVDALADAHFDAVYRGPTARADAARAALLSAHAAAVLAADAAGYARAMGEVDAAIDAVGEDGRDVAILRCDPDGWGAARSYLLQLDGLDVTSDGPTPTAAILAAAAALSVAAPTPPALVHGGPPRDSLDDGR